MVDVETEIRINRPLNEVAEYAVNPDHAPKWYQNIKSVIWKTERPLQVGSEIAFVAHFLGKKLEYIYEVIQWKPNEIFVMQTAQGPFPMQTTYTWEAIDETSTRMRLRNTGKPAGFSKFYAPFMKRMMRKANQKDLILLKAILEKN